MQQSPEPSCSSKQSPELSSTAEGRSEPSSIAKGRSKPPSRGGGRSEPSSTFEGSPELSTVKGAYVKIFLCGEKGAGKTMLRKCLAKKFKEKSFKDKVHEFIPDFFRHSNQKKSPTMGIEVEYLRMKEDNVEVALWQLSGHNQEEKHNQYEVLYPAFLPPVDLNFTRADGRAIGQTKTFFIIVSESTFKPYAVFYWLSVIASYSRRSRSDLSNGSVIVVVNSIKAGAHHLQWTGVIEDYKYIFRAYLNLHDKPLMIYNKRKAAMQVMEHFRPLLQQSRVPSPCAPLLKQCKRLRRVYKGEDSGCPVILWEEYCHLHDLQYNGDTAELLNDTNYLHAAGQVIFIRSANNRDSRDNLFLVLDPKWFFGWDGQELPRAYYTSPSRKHLYKVLEGECMVENFPREFTRLYRRQQNNLNRMRAVINDDEKWQQITTEYGNREAARWTVYSLEPKSSVTWLPLSVLRKLQEKLAPDPSSVGFGTGKPEFSYVKEGMAILVKYCGDPKQAHSRRLEMKRNQAESTINSYNHPKPNPNRLFVLVRPEVRSIISWSSTPTETPPLTATSVKQVKDEIKDIEMMTRDVVSKFCPGLELNSNVSIDMYKWCNTNWP